MSVKDRARWLHEAKWGVFIHYLGSSFSKTKDISDMPTAEQWNTQIDNFNVEGLVAQLVGIKARYLIFTIGQISGHYCSPNSAYDRYSGVSPSKCSRRDLIADLYTALAPHGIKLMVYFPSDAPRHDKEATATLGWIPWKKKWEYLAKFSKKPKQAEVQRKWEEIITEYSTRWGKNVHGWWIDGCYTPKAMYMKEKEPNFKSFARALRAGNPDSIIAFNPGVKIPIITMTPEEDYTAGEIAGELPHDHKRWVNQAQYHVLTYIGESWGRGKPRFDAQFVKDYVGEVNKQGGAITWDVGPTKEG